MRTEGARPPIQRPGRAWPGVCFAYSNCGCSSLLSSTTKTVDARAPCRHRGRSPPAVCFGDSDFRDISQGFHTRRSKSIRFNKILNKKRYFFSPGRSRPPAPTGPDAQNRCFLKVFLIKKDTFLKITENRWVRLVRR